MPTLNTLKENYIKWAVVLGLVLFLLGLTVVIIFRENEVMIIIGSSFIQLGITIFVVDLFISRIGSQLLKKQIMEGFRQILGIEDKENKLFPELIRLIRPHPYIVLSNESIHQLFYDPQKKKDKFNLGVMEISKLIVQAHEDNVQFHFFRGITSGENYSEQLKEVILEGIRLDFKDDIIIKKDEEKKCINYYIKHPLKKGKSYKIEIKHLFPACMSDLNNGIDEDYFDFTYIELTNKANLKFKFPFSLKGYSFSVKRLDACRREKLLSPEIKGNSVIIKQENLDNSEHIYLKYKKLNSFKIY